MSDKKLTAKLKKFNLRKFFLKVMIGAVAVCAGLAIFVLLFGLEGSDLANKAFCTAGLVFLFSVSALFCSWLQESHDFQFFTQIGMGASVTLCCALVACIWILPFSGGEPTFVEVMQDIINKLWGTGSLVLWFCLVGVILTKFSPERLARRQAQARAESDGKSEFKSAFLPSREMPVEVVNMVCGAQTQLVKWGSIAVLVFGALGILELWLGVNILSANYTVVNHYASWGQVSAGICNFYLAIATTLFWWVVLTALVLAVVKPLTERVVKCELGVIGVWTVLMAVRLLNLFCELIDSNFSWRLDCALWILFMAGIIIVALMNRLAKKSVESSAGGVKEQKPAVAEANREIKAEAETTEKRADEAETVARQGDKAETDAPVSAEESASAEGPTKESAEKPAGPPADVAEDKYTQIAKLKELLDSGALTQAEFDAEKRKILGE